MLCLAGMLLYASPAFATPFPDKTDEVVQDADNFLKKEEKAKFADALKENPGTYKVVVVESTSPEAESPDDYAQKLFDNYNLADDSLMVVLDTDAEQLGVYAGPGLQAKGATMEMLHDKITSFYEPFRNQKQYLTGIQTMITEVNAELNRISNKPATNAPADAKASTESDDKKASDLGGVPWWIYLIGAIFAALSIGLIYAMIRRRSIFAQVDEVEDWKDEVVDKINQIEVEKRRSSATTEVRYHHLADKKENLLRIRVPDVEMMILDAEEACDRFRFSLALGMLGEARELLTEIETELAELKTDAPKVEATKKESETKVVIPEIGKLVEQVERRLSDLRLEYGLSFHELKSTLDEVETMRNLIKTARAAGDDLQAYNTTLKAQQLLEGVTQSMEQIPSLVQRVQKEMPEEFKQLEEGIDQAHRDGFQLEQDALDKALLQAKQLLTAAKSALEEGNLEMVRTHQKAFEVLVDTTYQNLEEAVLAHREAAVGAQVPVWPKHAPSEAAEEVEETGESFRTRESDGSGQAAELHWETDMPEETALASKAEREEEQEAFSPSRPDRVEQVGTGSRETLAWHDDELPAELNQAELNQAELSKAERDVLLNAKAIPFPTSGRKTVAPHQKAAEPVEEAEDEYELVIPKRVAEWEEAEPEPEPLRLVIETEDDALDELERISGTLIRVRQQIKRSYLPGIPDHLKYMFEEVVQTLSQIKAIMEQYRYDLEEVAILINDANELVGETERMAERIISTCQLAEGAIQYTNRYRRQNRQVNELLTKAEQSFRQLAFAEAYQLAEEARLVVEGAPEEMETRWLLRRKKKG